MKRINSTIIIALAAVAMLATGCKKEQTGKTVTLGASIASNNSKVYIDNLTPKWQEGDEVSVNGTPRPVSNINGGTANITGVNEATTYRCMYPASIAGSFNENATSVPVSLPTTQTYAVVEVDEREYQTVAVPMSGATSGSTVTFHNLCSVLKVTFHNSTGSDQTLKKIRVTAATSYLSGSGTAQVRGEASDKVELSSGKKYVDLDLGSGVAVNNNASKDFYVVLPEFSEQNVTIEFVKSDNMAASISLINVALGHNKLVSKTCTVNSDGFNERFIPGEFSVDDGRTVRFSPGNLQYNNGNWRFAENQYDYRGAWNTSNWVDLFGWGTWTTGNGHDPLNVSTENTDYSLVNNDFQGTIAGAPGPWRTLTQNEWNYLLYERETSSISYVFATVDNKYGLVILPDDWSSSYWDFSTNNDIDSDVWTSSLEAHGAVFLPAAGYRNGTTVDDEEVGASGDYWSSSDNDNGGASSIYFNFDLGDVIPADNLDRYIGRSVRLVQDL